MNEVVQPVRMIAVEWDANGMRAAALCASGLVRRQWTSPLSVAKVEQGGHSTVLRQLLGRESSLLQSVPVYLCGTVCSREGWREVAQINCPAGVPALAAGIAQIREDGMRLRFIPGLRCRPSRPQLFGDVMHGEETRVLGATEGEAEQLVVTPGAHSKWVRVKDGFVQDFRTFLTGDLFAAIGRHTIVSRAIDRSKGDAKAVAECFEAGVKVGASIPALAELVFQPYLGDLLGNGHFDAASYLSGALIGNELSQGLSDAGKARAQPLVIVGKSSVTERYLQACKVLDIAAIQGTEHAAFMGCRRLARARAEV